jgi:hypothetical protein
MTHFACLAAALAVVIAAAPVSAAAATPVDWSRLPEPSAQEFEDPYRDLAPEQMRELMSLVRLREELAVEGLTNAERTQLEARSVELESALRAGGIDVDWLLSQRWAVADRRRQAAVAANMALDGQLVEITGFLVPALTDSGEAGAYLMPDRRVCNHLPPPPPNQLVRLRMEEVVETRILCQRATVRGTLRARETRHEVVVIDHSLPMWSAWTLEAVSVPGDG